MSRLVYTLQTIENPHTGDHKWSPPLIRSGWLNTAFICSLLLRTISGLWYQPMITGHLIGGRLIVVRQMSLFRRVIMTRNLVPRAFPGNEVEWHAHPELGLPVVIIPFYNTCISFCSRKAIGKYWNSFETGKLLQQQIEKKCVTLIRQ